eukprot:jgi/Botrbrau1/189/Bobra.0022s0169.1
MLQGRSLFNENHHHTSTAHVFINRRSIKKAVEGFKGRNVPLHGLINNAGVGAPKGQAGQETSEGIEVTLATNYFGPFYFTMKLLPLLKQSAHLAPARIVWHSSGLEALGKVDWDDLRGVRRNPSGLAAYSTSKLMDLMAAEEMARRFARDNIRVFAVHPGVTNSGIYVKNDHRLSFAYALDWINYFIGQPPKRGARPLIYAATAAELDDPKINGSYFGGFLASNLWQTVERTPLNSQARDSSAIARLYDETLALVRVAADDPELPSS